MGIFSRLSDIISANINYLLDKAENPQATIKQIIREMDEGVAGAKRSAATAIAAEKRLKQELDDNRRQAEFWKNKAVQAVEADRDDLARRALLRKRELDDLAAGLQQQHQSAQATTENLKTTLRALEARLAEARRKEQHLLARRAAVAAQRELQGAVGIDYNATHDALRKFDRLEQEIAAAEAEAAACAEVNQSLSSLEAEFAELDVQADIDAELEALRREVKGDD